MEGSSSRAAGISTTVANRNLGLRGGLLLGQNLAVYRRIRPRLDGLQL
jgi:hypothetical protein